MSYEFKIIHNSLFFWLLLGFITNDLAFSVWGMKYLCLISDDFPAYG